MKAAMKFGLITDSVSHLPFEAALDLAQHLGLSSVEVAIGNWSEAPHADLAALVSSEGARGEFIGKITSRGLALSALTANGNQLHPTSGKEQHQVVHDTIEVASALGVPTVVLMSGLPGAHGGSSPNWVTTSTMLRLIEATGGDVVGANLDPSHLMWMGADIPTVIRTLGEAIFHVHAKDIRINDWISSRDGLLDTVPITEPAARAWNYVTLGLGHPGGATFWADFVYNLRGAGYDGTLNIEHEDALVNSVEGVGRATDLLKQVALVEPPDWMPANV